MPVAKELLKISVQMLLKSSLSGYHLVTFELLLMFLLFFYCPKYCFFYLFCLFTMNIGPEWCIGCDTQADVKAGYLTSKVICLFDSLLEYRWVNMEKILSNLLQFL